MPQTEVVPIQKKKEECFPLSFVCIEKLVHHGRWRYAKKMTNLNYAIFPFLREKKTFSRPRYINFWEDLPVYAAFTFKEEMNVTI